MPKEVRLTRSGHREAEAGGNDCPSTYPRVSAARAPSGLWWWPCYPTPPHPRRALWPTLSTTSSQMPPPPPAPASSRQHGLGPAGLHPICLCPVAWYRRPAAGKPAGCTACGFRHALHLTAEGDQRCAWYQATLPFPTYQPLESSASPPPVLHSLLGLLQPWVQVLGRSTQRLGTSATSVPLVVARVVIGSRNRSPGLGSSALWVQKTVQEGLRAIN